MNLRLGRALVATGIVVGCSFVATRDARATLGADVASIASNATHLSAATQVQKLASGEIHELRLPSGILVRQYIAPSGAVYAITWRGPRMPDLRELLGTYFDQLSAHPWGGHHRLVMTGSDFVVQSSGHRHTFAGRAWVPSLVPAGVNVDTAVVQ